MTRQEHQAATATPHPSTAQNNVDNFARLSLLPTPPDFRAQPCPLQSILLLRLFDWSVSRCMALSGLFSPPFPKCVNHRMLGGKCVQFLSVDHSLHGDLPFLYTSPITKTRLPRTDHVYVFDTSRRLSASVYQQ